MNYLSVKGKGLVVLTDRKSIVCQRMSADRLMNKYKYLPVWSRTAQTHYHREKQTCTHCVCCTQHFFNTQNDDANSALVPRLARFFLLLEQINKQNFSAKFLRRRRRRSFRAAAAAAAARFATTAAAAAAASTAAIVGCIVVTLASKECTHQ